MHAKLFYSFLFLCMFALTAYADQLKVAERILYYWVADRQKWQEHTRTFIKKYSNDPDAQILLRYLKLLSKHTLANKLPEESLFAAAERAVEYCPGGVAELEYVLTGCYPEGPCILIALTESVWLEQLKTIEEKIAATIKNR